MIEVIPRVRRGAAAECEIDDVAFSAAPSASPQIILILAQLSMAAINLFECGKILYYYINHPVVIENMQLRLYDKTINNLHDPRTVENVHFIIVIQKYVLYSGVKQALLDIL